MSMPHDRGRSIYERAYRALCVDRQIPYRLRLSNIVHRMTGYRFVYCRKGRRKTLRFKADDAYHIFQEVFVNAAYFPCLPGRRFTIEKGDVVIDIGANIGLFAVYAANLSRTGAVYAFEPFRENFDRLVFHKKLNRVRNLIPVEAAVADRSGVRQFHVCGGNIGEGSLYAHNNTHTHAGTVEVQCDSLRQIFDRYAIARCAFLKIDCEGAEYDILGALPQEYFSRIDKIAVEYHPTGDVIKLAEYLYRNGYRVAIDGYPAKTGMVYAYVRR